MYSALCRIAGLAFSFVLIATLEIWQERTSWFYLSNEWTSAFKGF